MWKLRPWAEFTAAEYDLPPAEVAAGYFADREALGTAAEIMGTSPAALKTLCRRAGVDIPQGGSGQLSGGGPRRRSVDDEPGYRAKLSAATRRAMRERQSGWSVRLIEHDGDSAPLAVMAERHGLNRDVLRKRLDRGWAVARALSEPPRRRRQSARGES